MNIDAEYKRYRKNLNLIAQEVFYNLGPTKLVQIGIKDGFFVQEMLSYGVDAYGSATSITCINYANALASNRFFLSSNDHLAFENSSFDTVVVINLIEEIGIGNIDQFIQELHRVTSRSVYIRLNTEKFNQNNNFEFLNPREYVQEKFFNSGFRNHPAFYVLNSYQNILDLTSDVTFVFEKDPCHISASRQFVNTSQKIIESSTNRILTDEHVISYVWAATFIRPGDRVLNLISDDGYGAYIFQSLCTPKSVISLSANNDVVNSASLRFKNKNSVLDYICTTLKDYLSSIQNNAFDFIVGFDINVQAQSFTPDLIEELLRVLTPSGRCILSYRFDTNQTNIELCHKLHHSGSDFFGFYNTFQKHFIVEKQITQSIHSSTLDANNVQFDHLYPFLDITDVDLTSKELTCDAFIVLGMRTPVGGELVKYTNSQHPTFSNPLWNVTAFDRDYRNPWLIRGMVDIQHRLQNPRALRQLAESVITTTKSFPHSEEAVTPDIGAAFCVQAYQLNSSDLLEASEVRDLYLSAKQYIETPPNTPHDLRWVISLHYVFANLWMKVGDFNSAIDSFTHCISYDPFDFSPLIATKTVSSCLKLGQLHLLKGDKVLATHFWRKGILFSNKALTANWDMSLGDLMHPAEFGLPELSNVLDIASLCGYCLVNIDDYVINPRWWSYLRLNNEFRISSLMTHIEILNERLNDQLQINQTITELRTADLKHNEILLKEFLAYQSQESEYKVQISTLENYYKNALIRIGQLETNLKDLQSI